MENYSDPIHCPACGVKFKVALDTAPDFREGIDEEPMKAVRHPRKHRKNGKAKVELTSGNTRELIAGLLRDLPKGSYLTAGAIGKRIGKTINSTTSTLLQMTQKGELERTKEPKAPFAYRLVEKQVQQ